MEQEIQIQKVTMKDIHKLKIGVLGGGQLGRMFALSAANFGIHPYFLEKEKDFPAGLVSQKVIIGDFTNEEDVYNFGKQMDLVTIEIENVNTKALARLKQEGVKVFPDPALIEMIKDKGTQKKFYKDKYLPTSDFILVKNKEELLKKIESKEINIPFVLKSRTEGYDGKGVLVIEKTSDLERAFEGASIAEDLVDIEKELAVIVARNEDGDIETYPTVEMVFDPEANLVDYLQCPAEIDSNHDEKCQEIATLLAKECDLVGLLAIEFFLTKSGEIIINEMAPRTHNSGHITMEACITSQFEQHLRSICNLRLGKTDYVQSAMMLNLLGRKDYTGPANYPSLDEICKKAGVHVHIYGKKISKPKRKMGHINITATTLQQAKKTLQEIKAILES